MPPPKGSFNPIEGPGKAFDTRSGTHFLILSGDYDVTSDIHNDTYPAIDSAHLNLKGKAVFISGGSKGIGKDIVLSFARAGVSHLAVGARSDVSSLRKEVQAVAKEAGKPAPQFLPLKVDITSQSSIEHAATEIERVFGHLDIIVNNAGSFYRGMIAESDPEEWWGPWQTNVRGTYLICKAFIPLLLKGGDKTIVNVSSVGAHCKSPTLSAYQTSKLAVTRFSEFVAAEYGDQGLLCYSVHPGNVPDTGILGPGGIPRGMEHIFVDTARLCGDTIVFLTREKRDWLTGRYINVTWDMPELMAKEYYIVKGDKLKVKLDF